MKKTLLLCLMINIISSLSFGASLSHGSRNNINSSMGFTEWTNGYSDGNDNSAYTLNNGYIFGGNIDDMIENGINMGTNNRGNTGGLNTVQLGHHLFNPGLTPKVNSVGSHINQEVSNNSSVFGNDVDANGITNSVSLGNDNNLSVFGAGMDNSVVLGSGNTVSGSNNAVLGMNTTVTHDNSITIGTNSTSAANSLSIGNDNTKRKIVYVTPADISATSTDVVNGSQLHQLMNGTINIGTTTIGGTGTNITGITDTNGNVATLNQTNNSNTIGIVGTNNITTTVAGNNLQITDSITPTFGVVNINTLTDGIINGLTNVTLDNLGSDNTRLATEGQLRLVDEKISVISNDIDDVVARNVDNKIDSNLGLRFNKTTKKIDAGIASGMATGILPQAIQKGQDALALGIGTYGKGYAIAAGWSRTSLSEKSTMKISASINNSKNFGLTLGFSHLLENDR